MRMKSTFWILSRAPLSLLDGLLIHGSMASVVPAGVFTTKAAWPYQVTSVLPLPPPCAKAGTASSAKSAKILMSVPFPGAAIDARHLPRPQAGWPQQLCAVASFHGGGAPRGDPQGPAARLPWRSARSVRRRARPLAGRPGDTTDGSPARRAQDLRGGDRVGGGDRQRRSLGSRDRHPRPGLADAPAPGDNAARVPRRSRPGAARAQQQAGGRRARVCAGAPRRIGAPAALARLPARGELP